MSADLLRGLFLFGKKRFFIFFGISLCFACGDIVSGGGAEAAYFGCENDEKIGMIIADVFCGKKSLNLILYARCSSRV